MTEDLKRQLASMTPEDAVKLAHALQSYGRVEVVLSRSELNKLFAGDVGVIYCEYDQRSEELRICVEGSGLWKNWREGQRPFNVRGKLLDSSYVMMEKDEQPRRYLIDRGFGMLGVIPQEGTDERVQ